MDAEGKSEVDSRLQRKNPSYTLKVKIICQITTIMTNKQDDVKEKEFLTRQGIQLSLVSYQSLLFNYLSFCRSINVNTIGIITSIGSPLDYDQFLLQQEFYNLFMKKFPELKYLDMKSIRHQIFYFPEARIRLESLCELKCDTLTNSSYFYGLAQLCHYIQRLIITNATNNYPYHGIAELIGVQKNLKYFEWRDDDALYITGPDRDSHKEILFALEKNANVINHLILYFMYNIDCILPRILPKLHKLKTLATRFYNFSEQQLKTCVFHDLEILKIEHYNLESASIIIENSGGHIKKILLEPFEFDDNVIEDSLVFISSIRKNCPSIECLSLVFSPSKEYFAEIEELLKGCQNLKLLLLVIFDQVYEEPIYIEKALMYGEILLKILISSAPSNIKEIRFYGDFKFSLEALEEFLRKWEGCTLSILISSYNLQYNSIYEEEDYKKLINKYKNNGVIKDFRGESHMDIMNIEI
ncbi:20869_t:CDS:2 [Rhizophagus irregularis]|nr:20869_t:CDS:2 [Rhizophagus irregularis]